VTKLNRWPGNQYRQPAPEVEIFPDFDETLTTGLEDTVRNLHIIRQHSGREHEERQLENQILTGLMAEAKKLRETDLPKLIATIKTKASKGEFAVFTKASADGIDARIATIRTVATWAIGIQFLLIIFILGKVLK
jgi:hypothetical protein